MERETRGGRPARRPGDGDAGAPARRAAALGWSAAALSWLLAPPAIVLLALGAGASTGAGDDSSWVGSALFLVAGLAYATVGALVTARVPGNAVGPLLCVSGVLFAGGGLALLYAEYGFFVAASPPPGATAAALLQNLLVPPVFGLLGLTLLLFPDGRLPSPRWRPVAVLCLAGIALIVVGTALRPGPLDPPWEDVDNPLGVPGTIDLLDLVAALGWLAMIGGTALAAVAMTRRLRRSRGVEHQQLRWIALAAVVAGALLVADFASYMVDARGIDQPREALQGLAFVGFPLAAGVAILRYRLYDLDLVVNRALVYGALTATLAATYLGSVLLLQLALSPVTRGSQLAVAGSTLAVAALFRPARARIQAAVDHRFFRRRYDAQRTLEAFSARLRDELDLDALSTELRRAVDDAIRPAHVSLWLCTERPGDARPPGAAAR